MFLLSSLLGKIPSSRFSRKGSGRLRTQTNPSGNPRTRALLHLETLESRWVPTLSVTGITSSLYNDATGGLYSGGTLTITGTGFDSTAAVFFQLGNEGEIGLNPATIIDGQSLTTSYSPMPGTGNYSVIVHCGSESATAPMTFDIMSPQISSVTPDSTPSSNPGQITITGKYLTASPPIAFFGGPTGPAENGQNISDTQMTVIPPLGQNAGKVDLLVQVQAVSSNAMDFTFTAPPAPEFALLEQFSYPNFGSQKDQKPQPVTVFGTNLDKVSSVEFWDSPTTPTTKIPVNGPLNSDSGSLTFNLPSGLSYSGNNKGAYFINLIDQNGSNSVLGTRFTFSAPAVVASTLTFASGQSLSGIGSTLEVYSTGDFIQPSSGSTAYLFLQTNNGIALASYTGVTYDSTNRLNDNPKDVFAGQFTGVKILGLTSENPIPSSFANYGILKKVPPKKETTGFDTNPDSTIVSNYNSVMQADPAITFQSTINVPEYLEEPIYLTAFWKSCDPNNPTTYYLTSPNTGQYVWNLSNPPTPPSASSPIPSIRLNPGVNTLNLPLFPTNSAEILLSYGTYPVSSNVTGGIPLPTPFNPDNSINSNIYDFIEFTLDSSSSDNGVSFGSRHLQTLTIDTTQVDQWGLPIMLQANHVNVVPVIMGSSKDSQIVLSKEESASVGNHPAYSRHDVFENYGNFVTATNNGDFAPLLQKAENGSYLRLVSPKDYTNSLPNDPLNYIIDDQIYQLFTTPTEQNPLKIVVGKKTYDGYAAKTGDGYQVLRFGTDDSMDVYMPLFSNNRPANDPNNYYQNLPAPPSITNGSKSSGYQAFGADGVFVHGGKPELLAIEDQLAGALNRGVANLPLANYATNTDLWNDSKNHYPTGVHSNAYAQFFHLPIDPTVSSQTLMYGATLANNGISYGLAYGQPYDDNGGYSTTMTIQNDITSLQATIGAWSTANLVSTTSTLVSSQNPSTVEDQVTFTATVTASSGSVAPTGTVKFSVGGVQLGSPVTLVAGQGVNATATIDHVFQLANQYPILATYSGSPEFGTSYAGITQIVNGQTQTHTQTKLVSSQNPSTMEEQVTFTATVTASSGSVAPTGKVQFSVDGDPIGSPVTLVAGPGASATATFAIGPKNPRQYSIQATYTGSSEFGTSNAGITQIVKGQTPTQTNIEPGNGNGIYTVHQPVVLIASVVNTGSGLRPTPTGTVAFYIQGTNGAPDQLIGSGSVKPQGEGSGLGIAGYVSNPQSGSNPFPVGTYLVYAKYQGSTVFELSESSTAAVSVQSGYSVSRSAPLPLFDTLAIHGVNQNTRNDAIVTGIFQGALGRLPDPGAVQQWAQDLSQGNLTPEGLTRAIYHSEEYFTRVVDSLYTTHLLRQADSQGLGGYVKFLQNGGSMAQVTALLLGSDEYRSRFASDAAWVNSIYHSILGREVGADGLRGWVGQLSLGVSRVEVAQSIIESDEAYKNSVDAMYNLYFGRSASEAGKTGWTDVARKTDLLFVLANLMDSEENNANADKAIGG